MIPTVVCYDGRYPAADVPKACVVFSVFLYLCYPALGCKDDGRTCTRPASESRLRPLSCRVASDLSESRLKKGVLTSLSIVIRSWPTDISLSFFLRRRCLKVFSSV